MIAKAVVTNSDKDLPEDIAKSEQAGGQQGKIHDRRFNKWTLFDEFIYPSDVKPRKGHSRYSTANFSCEKGLNEQGSSDLQH